MTTVFEKIINGEIPCHKVYEDDHVLAFLDVAPLSKGHTLLVPKQIASSLHELSEESGAALGAALVKARARGGTAGMRKRGGERGGAGETRDQGRGEKDSLCTALATFVAITMAEIAPSTRKTRWQR